MPEQYPYFNNLKNELQNFKYLGRDSEYSEYEYKGWGIGFSGWIKHYIIDYSEEFTEKKERIFAQLKSAGLFKDFYLSNIGDSIIDGFSITIHPPLQSDREVFRVKAVNLSHIENKTLDKEENLGRSFIQFTNGRKGSFYKKGDIFDLTLLEDYSEITNKSSFAEKSTAELDTFLRMIKFIDELEGK